MTSYTSPDRLPAPDDYQRPADSPAAFRALADATQAALGTVRSYALARISQVFGAATDVAVSQKVLTDWKNALEARTIAAGTGLTGGGSLAASRTLAVDETRIATRSYALARVSQVFGAATDVAVSQKVLTDWKNALEARSITAGTGLAGGGSLAASRTLTVDETRIATRDHVTTAIAAALAAKSQSGTTSGTYTTGGFIVTYPTPFATIPRVLATVVGSSGGATPIVAMVYNPQKTAFSLKLFDLGGTERPAGSGYNINWQAEV